MATLRFHDMSDHGRKQLANSTIAREFYEQDLQLQTTYSDGKATIDQIVQGSIKNGRKIIGITDHAIGWDDGDEHARFFMTAREFKNYLDDISLAKEKYKADGVTVLAGLEVEIGFDGRMALGEGIIEVVGSEEHLLEHIDYVIGVIHSESFTVGLRQISKEPMDEKNAELLVNNVRALIANPRVLIWGHPFQAVHGHYLRDFTPAERKRILTRLKSRQTPLLLEYNLNPTPRYMEWNGKSTHYDKGTLVPNDMGFFEACLRQGSKFVISTDAHDVGQTARLTKQTLIPPSINDNLLYFNP
jgi:histidinol phosphatase-like PHP family hydrolase